LSTTESLLSELGRIRGLALNIPAARNDILGPINSVIDALWDLEERLRERLRYCFHLHCDAQRSKQLEKSRLAAPVVMLNIIKQVG